MSVYRRGDSWYIDVYLGGVRINRKAANTKKEAKEIAEELKTKFRLKQLHVTDLTNDVFFGFAAEEYLEHTKKTKSSRTYELDCGDYRKHIESHFTSCRLQDIDNELLNDFQENQKSAGLANRTVNIHIGLVRKIMNYSKEKKYITNVDLKYPMLVENKKEHAFLAFKEYELLINNVTYDLALKRIEFGSKTGLRPAELTFLAWPDVDFEMRTIKIQAKMEWKPKTSQERTVPLNKTAFSILKELYKRRKGNWVFSNSNKPVKSIRTALRTAARNAGLTKKMTPNMLRHTFATHALIRGADLKSIQEILGQKNISTTERYLHGMKEIQRNAVSLVDRKKRNKGKSRKAPTFSRHKGKKSRRKHAAKP